MDYTIRECCPEDLSSLREISYNTFNDTFRAMNTPDTMEAYLDQAFNIDKLRGELENKASTFYFLYADGRLAGYIKLNEGPAQTDVHDPDSLELERIYVINEFQGSGLGKVLMNKAIEIAKTKGKSYIWLGVWEKNAKALQFYKRNGFYVAGTHSFIMGEEDQTDFIIRRDL